MDRIVEALRKLVPDDQINEVAGAVKDMLEGARADLEKEFDEKLQEAYAQLSEEMTASEKTAYQGYQEAYSVIADLRNRLETQGQEYKAAMDEGYEEAYQMLLAEREKNNTLEVDMYEEYDKKLAQMKDYIVEKVDQFLQFKGAEIYEQAKRDVLNDPRQVEHKVALDRIVDITANYLSDEDYAVATSTKLEETRKSIEELRGQLRIMEARNIRLSTDNTRLNEQVKQAADMINESRNVRVQQKRQQVLTEQKDRTQKARNASGRGHISTEEGVVIAEHNNANSDINELLVLSGVKKTN